MPKVSDAHLRARRQQILDAAVACFARQGFHRTTMQDIVREAGLSPGAIYCYFAGKEAIIDAIGDARHAREVALIAAARDGELVDVLGRLARNFFGLLDQPGERQRRRVGLQLWAEALRNPRLLRQVRAGVDRPRAMLARLVRVARARGTLPRALDPDAAARVMIALFQGFILQQAWDPRLAAGPYLAAIELGLRAVTAPARPDGESRLTPRRARSKRKRGGQVT